MGKKWPWCWHQHLTLFLSFWGMTSNTYAVSDKKSEVEKGYASSYLPTHKGPLVNEEFRTPANDYLELNTKKMSIAERFDHSRRAALKSEFDFFSFFQDIGYDSKAEKWEGKCHQWAAGANDKNIKPLINQSKGILCEGLDGKGIVLEAVDLKELLTAVYPSNTLKLPGPGNRYAFFGGRYNKNKQQEDNINELDNEMMDSLGVSDFPPQLFHEKIHEYLNSGQGVVIDVDPREEVWNQPVHSADSKVEAVDSKTPPLLPVQLYETTAPEAQKKLKLMGEIDNVFSILVQNGQKTSGDSVSSLVDSFPLVSHQISPELMDQIKSMESGGSKLPEVVNHLLRLKRTTFSEALSDGLRLKSDLQAKKVRTKVDYLVETHFRGEGTPVHSKAYEYHIVEGPDGGILHSQWVGPNKHQARPDFLWVPECMSETCHQKAASYRDIYKNMPREQKAYYEQVGLTIGLSDLLQLMKECFPLDKAVEVAGKFIKNIESAENIWELAEEKKKEIAEDFKTIKDSKIPVKMDSIQRLMKMPGMVIDKDNHLVMTDWDLQTLECVQYKNGVSTKVDKAHCKGDPQNGKYEKWGLFNKECWEYSSMGGPLGWGPLGLRKWHRRVPMALCEGRNN